MQILATSSDPSSRVVEGHTVAVAARGLPLLGSLLAALCPRRAGVWFQWVSELAAKHFHAAGDLQYPR